MGNMIGRAIKVDETTLKKDIGYYASVLVEIDLAKFIPSKIWVESKYTKFEQAIHIPKLPKFCNHFQVIGHYVTEYRSKRSETSPTIPIQEPTIEKPKKKWRPKKPQEGIGFDICFPENTSTHFTESNVNTPNNSKETTYIPQQCEPSSGRFHLLQEPQEEFIDKQLNLCSNAPSITNVVNLLPPIIHAINLTSTSIQGIMGQGKDKNVPKEKVVIPNVTTSKQSASSSRTEPNAKDVGVIDSKNFRVREAQKLLKLNLLNEDDLLESISNTKQEIIVEVGGSIITGIHASSLTVDRRELWNSLEEINSLNKPWLIIGDFNAVLSIDAKK
ncbi:uncharacterized protein LOC113312630 [Papaver somniferum]|uniref:uncharacterized protein LOC113312630 n=1 Tax=Papaver somniferum TaxID=3469 RepID=UPI000E700D99|nr:uncharacterized protein LOC113312630 [Papaver somniferum]